VKSFFLLKQLETVEIFNYTEFQETFEPFSSFANTGKVKEKYEEVRLKSISCLS
jgi:hypothetical protein